MKTTTKLYVAGGLCALAAIVGILIMLVPMSKYSGDDIRLYIPHDADAEAVADSLKSKLGSFGDKVALLWNLQRAKAARSVGSYVVKSGSSALQVSRMLKQGRQTPVRVTFNNVRTISDLAERVSRSMDFEAADFIAACDSVLPSRGYAIAEYPAAFLPDTYEFYWNAPAIKVVGRLADFHDRFWSDDRKAKAEALGISPTEAVIIASIVEEETNKADEMPKVARLYLNRLDRGMPLQADPTVKYALGDFSLRRILSRHLAVDSPYNTYKNAGLPPGPIRVASQRGIDAVLNAPAHGYLYMCAKADFSGYHAFAADFAAHQRNARAYQAELNRRGVK